MKFFKPFLFFGTFFIFSLFIAFCSKTMNDSIVTIDFDTSEVKDDLNITITKTSQDDIIIITQGKNAEPNTLYFFQSLNIPQNINIKMAKATFIKSKDYILVHSDSKNVLLSLKGAKIPEKVQKLDNLITYQGFGLNNYKKPESYIKVVAYLSKVTVESRSAGNSYIVPIDFSSCKCYATGTDDKGACKSGGPGATACSADHRKTNAAGNTSGSACSVNFDKGYYACCITDD